MTGGTNVTAAIRAYDTSIPTDLTTATRGHSDDCYWSEHDIGEIAQLYSEQNVSVDKADVREIHVWQFADENLEAEVKDTWIDQYMTDTDNPSDDEEDETDGVVYDYRLTDAFIKIQVSDELRDAVQDDFWDGIEGSSADIEALSWPSWGGISGGITGTGAEMRDALGDGLSGVWGGSMATFGMWQESAGNLLSDGWGGFTGAMKDGANTIWSTTNALIGNLVKGAASFVMSLAGQLLSGTLGLFTKALSLLWGGTLGKWTMIIVLVIVIVVLVILQWKFGLFNFLLKPIFNRLGKSSSRKVGAR